MRVLLFFGALVAVAAAVGLISSLSPKITATGWRVLIAVVIGGFIARLGVAYFRQISHPPSPDTAPTEVPAELGLTYVCEMCGMELRLLKVAKEKPPKHCGEDMVLVMGE